MIISTESPTQIYKFIREERPRNETSIVGYKLERAYRQEVMDTRVKRVYEKVRDYYLVSCKMY